jgi:putative nucleotidyltransferase with HDIG domain
LLAEARARERAGCVPEAIEYFEAASAEAERHGERSVLAEALRRCAVLHYHRGEPERAREMGTRSHAVSVEAGHTLLAAEALNSLAVMDLQSGALDRARATFDHALTLGGDLGGLRARVEQNLGIIANIQGDHATALAHYTRSLEAYRADGDESGCAIAFHNLGMISADQELWIDADRYYEESRAIAERLGDAHLQGLCLVNQAEAQIARQHYDQARANAEAALAIFDQLGARSAKAEAYRMIGMVYRETGRLALAESRLRSAIELASGSGSLLDEAESSRELALLYRAMGRNQEALTLLNGAYRLFRRLDARIELVHVGGKVEELETTYLAVVREWGQSIESSDSYTHGHCERVAEYAVAMGLSLGLDDHQLTTLRLGAYLHDLGKVRVPHEILNKPGKLTRDEFEVIQMHPIWGIELLAAVEFPWDIKPIIRWHHEKMDGSGYPDRLCGDEIPVAAQIIGIVDVYDALTTTRSYRPALSHERAMAEIQACRAWWREDVYEAFRRAVPAPARVAA